VSCSEEIGSAILTLVVFSSVTKLLMAKNFLAASSFQLAE
jgi:hypothetical protein